MNDILQNINESERGGLIDLGKALRKILAGIGGLPTPPPPSGSGGGWAQFGTEGDLSVSNPTLSAGTSGYETDTFRWKLGDGVTAWNDLPYQDTPLTPDQIFNPGATVTFDFRPLATQVIEFTTIADTTTFVSELQIPTNPPPIGHEGIMFVRVINTSLGTLDLQVTNFNIFGETFDGILLTNEAIEFSLWTLTGDWYVEGGPLAGVSGPIENADLAEVATGTIKGRLTAATGLVEDLTILQVKNAILTTGSVTNALLSNAQSQTIKGRYTAGIGSIEDLTPSQVKWMTDFAPPNSVVIAADATLTNADHQGRYLVCTAAVNLTVNATTDFDLHCSTQIRAEGGTVTIIATATVNASSGLIIPQYATGVLRRMTTADVYSLEIMSHPKVAGANSVAAATASGTTTLSLSGDVASPGNNQVYGTNASGVRAWKADPSGTGGATDLAGLTDVSDAISGVEGHVLTYTSGAWINGLPPAGSPGSGTTVNSLADLTAIVTPTAGQLVTVLGHTTPADGGEGAYIWDSTALDYQMLSTATVAAGGTGYAVGDLVRVSGGTFFSADRAMTRVATLSGSAVATVTVIVPGRYTATPGTSGITTASAPGTGCTLNLTWGSHSDYGSRVPKSSGGTGRWVRFRDSTGKVNIKAFGAKGDGSTDDWQAIQRAFWSGAALYFPAGTYNVSKPLTWESSARLEFSGSTQDGYGMSAIVLTMNTEEPLIHKFGRYMKADGTYFYEAGYSAPVSSYSEKLRIENMKLQSSTSIYGNCCEVITCTQSFFNNVMFRSAFRGLTIGDQTADTTIIGCEFDSLFMTNFPWESTTGGVSNKLIARDFSWGLYICGHSSVYGSSMVGNGTGLRMSGNGNVFIGARLEVNNYGILMATTRYQVSGPEGTVTARSSIDGISLEANTIAIRVENMKETSITNFSIQGSPASGDRPTGEIGLHVMELYNTSTISNGSANGTFTHGAILNETRYTFERVTASGTVVSYAQPNNVFGQTGTDRPYFNVVENRSNEGIATVFSRLMLPGITGINIRSDRIQSRNLGDIVSPATGASTANVTFPVAYSRASFGFGTITTPTNGSSTLTTGTYYYATTVLSKTAETGIVYGTPTGPEHKTVAVTAGQAVQMTMAGGTVAALKRRIYRTKVNAAVGNFEGYWQQDNSGTTFTDIGQAFTGRAMPPINGNIMTLEEENANYNIVATPSWGTTVWVTNKATTGFTLNFGTVVPVGGTCSWLLFR